MEEREEFAQGLLLGAVVGILGGAVGSLFYQSHRQLSPDDILKKVKRSFLKEGPIEGSWISFETKPVQKFAIKTDTVEGGVTRIEDGQLASYEFIADAKTGAILAIERYTHDANNPYTFE